MYGVTPMSGPALWISVACGVALLGIWVGARRAGWRWLVEALEVGFLAGLLGTLAYDLVRVPFHLAGQRIFAPIGAYGVWILDADASSRYTHIVGWVYHFSNGITFGMMYSLWMRGRHWAWGIVWAFLLETIAVTSPFGRVFSLWGNYEALAIAYAGHVAYGLPLGLCVQHWDTTVRWITNLPSLVLMGLLLLAAAATGGPLVSPALRERDARTVVRQFRVEGYRLNPDFQRIERGGVITFENSDSSEAIIGTGKSQVIKLGPRQSQQVKFDAAGVHRVHVHTTGRSRSSFILVEPVEHASTRDRRGKSSTQDP